MDYYSKGTPGADNSKVTAAYLGEYESIAAARKSGAADIKGKLFGAEGYEANYSKGVYFSVFVGEDGAGQEDYHFCIKTKEGIVWKSSSTGVTFTGLVDKDGNRVNCYVVKPKDDSYAEGNYPVIMVELRHNHHIVHRLLSAAHLSALHTMKNKIHIPFHNQFS